MEGRGYQSRCHELVSPSPYFQQHSLSFLEGFSLSFIAFTALCIASTRGSIINRRGSYLSSKLIQSSIVSYKFLTYKAHSL